VKTRQFWVGAIKCLKSRSSFSWEKRQQTKNETRHRKRSAYSRRQRWKYRGVSREKRCRIQLWKTTGWWKLQETSHPRREINLCTQHFINLLRWLSSIWLFHFALRPLRCILEDPSDVSTVYTQGVTAGWLRACVTFALLMSDCTLPLPSLFLKADRLLLEPLLGMHYNSMIALWPLKQTDSQACEFSSNGSRRNALAMC